MELEWVDGTFSVLKVYDKSTVPSNMPFIFVSQTDNELSVVCPTSVAPDVPDKEDGWSMFRVKGQLDFSLVGIISRISSVLAAERIGLFVISTFDTDYVLVKDREGAEHTLTSSGYTFVHRGTPSSVNK